MESRHPPSFSKRETKSAHSKRLVSPGLPLGPGSRATITDTPQGSGTSPASSPPSSTPPNSNGAALAPGGSPTPTTNPLSSPAPGPTPAPAFPFGPAINGNNTNPSAAPAGPTSLPTPPISSSPPHPQPTDAIASTPTNSQASAPFITPPPTPTPTPTGPAVGPSYRPPKPPSESSGIATTTMKTTVLVLVVVGVIYLLWSVIRKWKFKPSQKFEHRLDDDYDENIFDPRPPSFAGKRSDVYQPAASLTSATTPPTDMYGGSIADYGNSTPHINVAGYGTAGFTPIGFPLRVGEIRSNTPQHHVFDQDIKNGSTLFPDSPQESHPSQFSQNAPRIPPPVFDSNTKRSPDVG